tara:strand:+ start:250 stop:1977 length:1728 start_codon:yes stop_codon:yes gene_type:complete
MAIVPYDEDDEDYHIDPETGNYKDYVDYGRGQDPLGDALDNARNRPKRDPMSLPGMQNTSEPEFHPGDEDEEDDEPWTIEHEDATPGAAMNINPRKSTQDVLDGREPVTGEPKIQGTFKDLPFNRGTGFTMGEPMKIAWQLLKEEPEEDESLPPIELAEFLEENEDGSRTIELPLETHPGDEDEEYDEAWAFRPEDFAASKVRSEGLGLRVNPEKTMENRRFNDGGRNDLLDPKTQGTFKTIPFNRGTGFTMGEPMEIAWQLLKGNTIRKAWPDDDFMDHSGFANPDGTPYEGDSEALMQQRIQEIADVHNMSLSDLYRVYDWGPDEHTGHSPEEIAEIEADWNHPWHEDWDDLENAKLNWNSIKAHTNHMLDSGVKTIDGDHGPSGNSWTMGTTDPNWIKTHADEIARKLEFYNDLYGHYTTEPTKYSTPDDKNPSLHWNPSLSKTHGEEWFDKKHLPHRNPLMEGDYFEDVKNDPFRMTRPDIESEIEEMAIEMGRRRGRKDAVQEDKMNEEDPGLHGLDEHLRQNYFKNLFDRENPQNERLINVTAPQMREREAALNAELDRRAEKGRKNRV